MQDQNKNKIVFKKLPSLSYLSKPMMYSVNYTSLPFECPYGIIIPSNLRNQEQVGIEIFPQMSGIELEQLGRSFGKGVISMMKFLLCFCNHCQDKHCVLLIDGGDLSVVGFNIAGKAETHQPFYFYPYAIDQKDDS